MKRVLTIIVITLMKLAVSAQEYGSWNVPIPDLDTWYAPVPDFQPVLAGEHPRLLFRQKDLAVLRQKQFSEDGAGMLKRLRYLLDGANGEGLPAAFNDARQAYALGDKKNLVVEKAGTYTFGHVAGYGLLYQVTGEQKYAELGRQCFEMALAGQRDRDDRYSWVKPGGPLRAGVVLGWMAVGYDLCYNGWDTATRRRLGQAMEHYTTGEWVSWGKREATLDAMVTGTMPPKSNHFGMMAGGTALVLLALHKEVWVNQSRLDTLLEQSRRSMVHNVTQGFGNGGYFAEGDGTGSMASHLVYLAAVQGWKNAMGLDMVNSGRPNVYMTALKWFYLTVMRQERPLVWPIRGGYPHNVWSTTISGTGYVGQGLGAVPTFMQPAILWCYYQWLHGPNQEKGLGYEASPYPHFMVSAYIHWPVGRKPINPANLLPHGYSDDIYGFFAWRNRWLDGEDAVVTWLSRAAKGFMGSLPDSGIHVLRGDLRYTWIHPSGPIVHQKHNKNRTSSSLRLEQGITLGVDVSGRSGYDVLLLSTYPAEGIKVRVNEITVSVKGIALRGKIPDVKVKGNEIRIGMQRIIVHPHQFEFL